MDPRLRGDDNILKIFILDLEKNKMKSLICLIFGVMLITSLSAQVTTDMVNENGEDQTFIGAQGIAINSLIHFKDSWKDASGFFVTYGSISSNNWSLIFETGYMSFNANEDAGFTGDSHFNLIPLQIGTRYYLALDRFRPFLLAMNGINIISQKYTAEEETVDETRVQYNFQVGLGLGIMLFSNLEIEGQAKYNSHLLEPSLPYNITGVEYGLALNWHLR
jgi:hypothetical protein